MSQSNTTSTPVQPLGGAESAVSGFTLEAFAANGQPVTQFATPLTVQVDYQDEDLAARSIREDTLNLAY